MRWVICSTWFRCFLLPYKNATICYFVAFCGKDAEIKHSIQGRLDRGRKNKEENAFGNSRMRRSFAARLEASHRKDRGDGSEKQKNATK
jgi:hypothetical protein